MFSLLWVMLIIILSWKTTCCNSLNMFHAITMYLFVYKYVSVSVNFIYWYTILWRIFFFFALQFQAIALSFSTYCMLKAHVNIFLVTLHYQFIQGIVHITGICAWKCCKIVISQTFLAMLKRTKVFRVCQKWT